MPKSATDVRAFLGLIRYLTQFLPHLAELTCVLTPLTTKSTDSAWPGWSPEHQTAFDAIKVLVTGRECLTTIDHSNPNKNVIFVTCDASDVGTGAVLSFGPTWETARPVAFESAQLNSVERNYPVHGKELLAIVWALNKWRCDLLGTPFVIRSDHQTLKNFARQKGLSQRQARWQEFLADYDFHIEYLPGPDNCVADALSRLPPSALAAAVVLSHPPVPLTSAPSVASVLSISADPKFLESIHAGYLEDRFAQKLLRNLSSIEGAALRDGLLYVSNRLVVPRVPALRETLFTLAHDSLGHFGADKSYAALRDSYYWPGMRADLEHRFLPSCSSCQRNKSLPLRPSGPLHPLPVPECCGDSVAIDFIGPLPEDSGFNTIISMTCRSGSDIHLVPARSDLTAEGFAELFFDNWYCDNGLPLEVVSDRDKLFVSRFWTAFTKLAGIRLKMSSAFHPQTDGSSECTNKTVNQCLHFHVERDQTGWVRALPWVCFHLMNTVNASTGFLPFQLWMGHSPHLIPPLVRPLTLATGPAALPQVAAERLVQRIHTDALAAADTLLHAKISQADLANKHRRPGPTFRVGDRVLLSTFHRRRDYQSRNASRAAKFMPRFDGPYEITKAFLEQSTYTLNMPNSNVFPTFHASQLKCFVPNNDALFPSRTLEEPEAVVNDEGEEWYVDSIADEKRG